MSSLSCDGAKAQPVPTANPKQLSCGSACTRRNINRAPWTNWAENSPASPIEGAIERLRERIDLIAQAELLESSLLLIATGGDVINRSPVTSHLCPCVYSSWDQSVPSLTLRPTLASKGPLVSYDLGLLCRPFLV